MTFGAGVMWAYVLLPIIGTLVMIALQVTILKRLRRVEAILENARQNNA
jgi:fumarate reductase subunit D